MTPQTIANEFLDLWEKAHDGSQPDYDRLATQFAVFAGDEVSGSDVFRELKANRIARGWPNPPDDPPRHIDPKTGMKMKTLVPTIEGAIITLWRAGLQKHMRALSGRLNIRFWLGTSIAAARIAEGTGALGLIATNARAGAGNRRLNCRHHDKLLCVRSSSRCRCVSRRCLAARSRNALRSNVGIACGGV
jgi:hypothetical protein